MRDRRHSMIIWRWATSLIQYISVMLNTVHSYQCYAEHCPQLSVLCWTVHSYQCYAEYCPQLSVLCWTLSTVISVTLNTVHSYQCYAEHCPQLSVLCWTLSTVISVMLNTVHSLSEALQVRIFAMILSDILFLLLQHQLWRLGSNPTRCLYNDNHHLAVQRQAMLTLWVYLKTPQKRDNIQHNICTSNNWILTN